MATLVINTGDKAFSVEPALNGITENYEKIWSENTGRTSSGKMTGDIIATKLTLSVTYPVLSSSQRTALNEAIADAFFTVTYMGTTYNMYAGTPSYPLYSNINGIPVYSGVAVSLIEQ